DFGEGIRSSYYFSKYKNENVTGDLNADQIDDLVLKVSSYTGGNTEYLDLFVFIREGNDWILKSKIESSDTKLKGCEIGQFIPQKIENNLLIGESLCFTEDDPRCCPSIKRIRKLKWSNNTFVAVK